ncbi:hypothetical protein NDU88_008944 [Pleurodeles waltl]|uniref:Uncharacterized protein n=1 Tax=Pleurodeles waltl TaxID=8319 RepID=A0AAV7QTF0_PLEWA|nr:hypothetical protein NDU88_008944 [Pleurodeles waltl]
MYADRQWSGQSGWDIPFSHGGNGLLCPAGFPGVLPGPDCRTLVGSLRHTDGPAGPRLLLPGSTGSAPHPREDVWRGVLVPGSDPRVAPPLLCPQGRPTQHISLERTGPQSIQVADRADRSVFYFRRVLMMGRAVHGPPPPASSGPSRHLGHWSGQASGRRAARCRSGRGSPIGRITHRSSGGRCAASPDGSTAGQVGSSAGSHRARFARGSTPQAGSHLPARVPAVASIPGRSSFWAVVSPLLPRLQQFYWQQRLLHSTVWPE